MGPRCSTRSWGIQIRFWTLCSTLGVTMRFVPMFRLKILFEDTVRPRPAQAPPRGWRGQLLNIIILERPESDVYFCTESTETWLCKVRMRKGTNRGERRRPYDT